MTTLTSRQAEIVAFIRDYVAVKRIAPTNQEIGMWLGISRQGVAGHIQRLEKMGVLSHVPGAGRTIHLDE